MVVQPVPWTSFDSGGLILHGPSAVRANKRSMYAKADQAGQMAQLYKGLNTLNALPWWVPGSWHSIYACVHVRMRARVCGNVGAHVQACVFACQFM